MKNLKSIVFLVFLVFLISENVFSQNRWWQREIPAPSANQIINPNYLSKKRELERTLDEMNDLARERNNSVKLGHTEAVKSADQMLQFMGKKMNTLENDLSKIPIYIIKPNTNQNNQTEINNHQQTDVYISEPSYSDSPANSKNSYLLTLYKISNCNKNVFKTDYDYNAESLKLYNELIQNVSQIVSSETNISSSSIEFIKKKIEYYQIFIKNWGNETTIGTKEAKKEIERLNEQIAQKERTELRKNTKMNIDVKFQGNFTQPIQIGTKHRHTFHHFYYVCLIQCSDNNHLTESFYCKPYIKYDDGCTYNLNDNWIEKDNLSFKITWGVKEVPLFEDVKNDNFWITKSEANVTIPIKLGFQTQWNINFTAYDKEIKVSDEYKIITP